MTIAQRIGDYSSPNSLGSRFRRKRIGRLLDMITSVWQVKGSCSIIDIGGTRTYWSIVPLEFLVEHGVTITISNIDDAEAAAGDRRYASLRDPDGVFTHAHADGCDLPYRDKSFDIVHSNSVIEHVGDWDRQVKFGREVERVATAYFVQTPNYWFPWEPHFGAPCFQYLPVPLQISLLMTGRRGFCEQMPTVGGAIRAIERCRLLDERRFRVLFPDAEIVRERLLGLTKSLIAIKRPEIDPPALPGGRGGKARFAIC